MTTNIIKTLIVLLITSALFGCGGGGDSTTISTPTPTETAFDLGKYVSLATGTSYTITFTGTDTTGASYTGSEQCNVVGSTTFEGKSVIRRNHILNLSKTGVGGVAAGTVSEYYHSDRTLYKVVYPNGIVDTPTNIFALPTVVQPGNFTGQSSSSSDGTSSTQTWQVMDSGNSTAIIVVTSKTNQIISGVDTLTVSTTGALLSMKQVIYDFPIDGVTTTLNGVIN